MSDREHGGGGTNVIIVDDNRDHLELIAMALKDADATDLAPIAVHVFTDPLEALASLPAVGNTVILCDYQMPGGTGNDWLRDFDRADVGPFILMSGSGDERVAAEAFRNGAYDYLVKPVVLQEPARLVQSLREALRRYQLETRNRDLARRLKVANAALERKNQKLAELTATAHRFVDNVAHELRTPLSVIREFAAITRDGLGGEVNDKQSEFLAFIIDASRDMAALVDDFLDTSRLRSRTLRVDRRRLDASEVIAAVRPILATRADAKSITLTETIDPDAGDAFCDAEKVGRVIVNLVVNAVKFSPAGSTVDIRVLPAPDGGIVVEVADAGPGMAAEQIAFIFERFSQVGEMQDTTSRGFGLGLNIARDLVWLNLGTLDVRSTVGAGSTFSFTLPPFDAALVLDRYLKRMADGAPGAAVSILRTDTVPTSGDDDPAETVRRALAAMCHPTDLVLIDDRRQSVTLVGLTSEPDRWAARLEHELAEAGEARDLMLRHVGTWPIRGAEEAIQGAAVNVLDERRCVA